MHFLYVIQSRKDLSFYIGQTDNLQRRIGEHNNGKSLSTKSKIPWEIIYVEIYRSKKDALERERRLKKHKTGWFRLKQRLKNSIFFEKS